MNEYIEIEHIENRLHTYHSKIKKDLYTKIYNWTWDNWNDLCKQAKNVSIADLICQEFNVGYAVGGNIARQIALQK